MKTIINYMFVPALIVVGSAYFFAAQLTFANDWTSFGGDTDISYTTSEILTFPLTNDWMYQCDHPPVPLFKNLTREAFDHNAFEGEHEEVTKLDFVSYPVISGNKICFADISDASIVCLDTDTGNTNWVYSVNSAVRVCPSLYDSKVYFGADDGYVYCLNISDGSLVWKINAAPEYRCLIATGHMISRYPVRTSVTIDNGIAYFGCGLFPNQGIWLNAVNAADGSTVWRKKIEFSANGVILIEDDRLYLPGGRVTPSVWNKNTGEFWTSQTKQARRNGGCSVINKVGDMLAYQDEHESIYVRAVDSGKLNNGASYYNTIPGDFTGFGSRQMIATDSKIFLIRNQRLPDRTTKRFVYALNTNFFAAMIKSSTRTTNFAGRVAKWSSLSTKMYPLFTDFFKDNILYDDLHRQTVWSNKFVTDCFVIISAGDHLFAGAPDKVFAFNSDTGDKVGEYDVDGDVYGLAVADGALFVSTDSGKVYCFRNSPGSGTDRTPHFNNPFSTNPVYTEAADIAIANSDQTNGFCLILGAGEGGGQLAYEISQRSQFTIIGVEDDEAKLEFARNNLRKAGLYGSRVLLFKHTDSSFPFPSMFANLIMSEEAIETGTLPVVPQNVLRMLKPYNGSVLLNSPSTLDWKIDGLSDWSDAGGSQKNWQLATRGEIAGLGVWDHQTANKENTFCTEDQYVGTNLVFQWIGNPGAADVVDRHYQAMPPLFRNGRLVYAGRDSSLICFDPYNGTHLWKRNIGGMTRQMMPMVNGFLCMDDDFVYVASSGSCYKINLDSGAFDAKLNIPASETGYDWGFIAVQSNLIYGTKQKEKASYNSFFDISAIINRAYSRPPASKSLFAENKSTGAVVWNYETNSVIVNTSVAFGNNDIFFVESYNSSVVNDADGCVNLVDFFSSNAYIVSLNAFTGVENWRIPIGPTGAEIIQCVNLMFKNNVLISQRGYGDTAGATGVYEFIAYNFANGNQIWSNTIITVEEGPGWPLSGTKNKLIMHPSIVGNKLYLHRNNFYKKMFIIDINTGARSDHDYTINLKACGAKPASASTLFYRRTLMEGYDIATQNRASINKVNRSSCWSSSIPCGGLLMMPEGGSGCDCGTPFVFSAAMAPRYISGTQIIATPSLVDIPEGGTNHFYIKLSAPPSNAVTVSVVKESGDVDITVSGGNSISFNSSDWNTDKLVTLSAAADADDNEGSAVIKCTGSNLISATVMAYEQELSPQNPSVIINNGELQTTNFVVELDLFAENPTPANMQISELSDFSDVVWINYLTNYIYTFKVPVGLKTIYARFSNGGNGISETVSDTIDILPEPGIVFGIVGVHALACLRKKV